MPVLGEASVGLAIDYRQLIFRFPNRLAVGKSVGKKHRVCIFPRKIKKTR